MKEKIIRFAKWVWSECKDVRTLLLFFAVVAVMYSPVYIGFALHLIFSWEWCSALATAYMLFWAGPFTPFFPLCIAITLGIKRLSEKLCRSKRKKPR